MSQDAIKKGIQQIVRATFPQIDFLGSYPCRVLVQHADGSLDLLPDDPEIPGHQNVPIRYGVPGVRATVPPGARVNLEFAGGDPQRPMATVWEPSAITELKLNEGSARVARVGDTVGAGTLTVSAAATVPPAAAGVIITFTYTPPGGAPQVQTVTLTGSVTGVAAGTGAALSGTITTGAAGVKA